jgi:AraC-like DNA-binding protein
MSMAEIADRNHVTIKTLERRFKKVFGVSPKLFADLLRLQQAAKNIRQDKQDTLNHGDLNEALGYGYYDQSHFVKACKKITGLTPKQLFTQLPGRVTDFLIE